MPNLKASLLLLLIAIISVACAVSTTRMTTLPTEGTQPNGEVRGTVVLFRVAGGDADSMRATLSTLPRWKWHYLVNVGSAREPLNSGRAFGAGQLDSVPKDDGWGFLTLPPGTYQLAFAAYRTRFAMPGAQRAALGFGQSGSAQLEVPVDATIVYVGTFDFTCHRADRWWGYVERECTKLEIRDERDLAFEVASGSLRRFGPMQTALASAAVEPSR